MIVKEKVLTEVQEITDIICDICGHSCKKDIESNICDYEYATLSASWGYYSNKDAVTWVCNICENCADKIMKYIVSIGGNIQVNRYD